MILLTDLTKPSPVTVHRGLTMLPCWFLVTIVIVRIIATCAMVSAGLPMNGVLMLVILHHVTTPPPSTLMTSPCVETPHSGEDCLVTTTLVMDHCPAPAGDVLAPCKHVPTFGILIRTDISEIYISPGPGAKTARTRSLD